MSNLITGLHLKGIVLSTSEGMSGRVFGLDMQFIVDACILGLAIFCLFLLLSYLVFNPARELLKKRQDKIKNEMDTAERERQDAIKFKQEYDGKLKAVGKEAEQLLSDARKKALSKENEIVSEAKTEASRIINRAGKEIDLEKRKMRDEVKNEMIAVASLMAGKIVAGEIDENKQADLIEETLKEMGDSTWQS